MSLRGTKQSHQDRMTAWHAQFAIGDCRAPLAMTYVFKYKKEKGTQIASPFLFYT
ncbi:MAG: hypothetical protein JWR38_2033 [Mucilaginibacter sp.]|nr:hypothetical protein [Mucilaginibacter sp.]